MFWEHKRIHCSDGGRATQAGKSTGALQADGGSIVMHDRAKTDRARRLTDLARLSLELHQQVCSADPFLILAVARSFLSEACGLL